MSKKHPLSEELRIDSQLTEAGALYKKTGKIGIHQWVRDLRKKLHMSQKQLAKRAKITQSNLSRIESGKTKISIETSEKIFNALFCDALIVPAPHENFASILKNQARMAAKKKLASLMGSMALEEQLPSPEYMDKKIEELATELILSGSTEIWDS